MATEYSEIASADTRPSGLPSGRVRTPQFTYIRAKCTFTAATVTGGTFKLVDQVPIGTVILPSESFLINSAAIDSVSATVNIGTDSDSGYNNLASAVNCVAIGKTAFDEVQPVVITAQEGIRAVFTLGGTVTVGAVVDVFIAVLLP